MAHGNGKDEYDGLHPNAKGYQIMATVLKNTLKKNGIRI